MSAADYWIEVSEAEQIAQRESTPPLTLAREYLGEARSIVLRSGGLYAGNVLARVMSLLYMAEKRLAEASPEIRAT
jgi:hypothetical protein